MRPHEVEIRTGIHCIQTWAGYIVSHCIHRSPLVSREYHVPPLLLYYTWCGSRRTNRHQRLGHDLAFAALGKGRDVCTTPGAVRVGVVATGGSLPTAVLAAYKSATLYPSILCTFVSAIVSALYPDLGWIHCITVYPQTPSTVSNI